MIGWLYRVIVGRFSGCSHEWEVLSQQELIRREGDTPHGDRFILKCKKCGSLKKKEFYE